MSLKDSTEKVCEICGKMIMVMKVPRGINQGGVKNLEVDPGAKIMVVTDAGVMVSGRSPHSMTCSDPNKTKRKR